jgi:hypothetical protein
MSMIFGKELSANTDWDAIVDSGCTIDVQESLTAACLA